MSDNKRYCMGCMKELDPQAIICPHCHYSTGMSNKSSYLNQGNTVADRYLIGKATAASNDSVIYIGLDKLTDRTVTVYEFFPAKLASREASGAINTADAEKSTLFESCLQSFLGLWRGIKMFDDVKCLPHITDIVRDNGTAYAIADYKETVALKDYFAKTKKPLPAGKAVPAFIPLVNALKLLHNAGIVHGNITPSTIQVGADGRLNLIGFSIPQCRSDIPELAAKPVSGFSALEIYQSSSAKTCSDIYSIMAVMYYSITGLVLPRATERTENNTLSIPASVAASIPAPLTEAFSRALEVQPNARLSDADELSELLRAARPAPAKAKQPKPVAPAAARPVPAARPAEVPEKAPEATPSKPDADPNEQTIAFAPQEYDSPIAEKAPAEESTASPVPNNNQRRAPQRPAAKRPVGTRRRPAAEAVSEDNGKDLPLPVLGIATGVTVVIICFILFILSYVTFLYKSVEIPVLDDIFSSFSILPMNKEKEDTEPTNKTPDVAVDNGPVYVTVPDFSDKTEDYIRGSDAYNKNFLFIYKYEASEKVAKGGVISQSSPANASVEMGSTIVLTISTGKPELIVPDVTGKTYEEAAKILKSAGFTVKKEILDNPDGRPANIVQTLSIEPGKGAAKGTEILVYVWDEPEVTTEPSTEPSTEPTTEATTQPTTQPTTEATTEPTTQPTTAATTQPSTEPSTQAPTTTTSAAE